MKELTIGEIAESFQNGIGKGKSYYGRGTKVANISDLYENPVFKPIKYSLLQVTDKEKKKYLLQKGDLLFVRSSLKREGVAFCSMYDSKEECLFSSFMIRVRLRKELSDPKYVSYILRSNVCRERLIGASNTSTITNINQEGLSSVQIPLPSLPIQQKIAAILDAADEYRQKTKALVAKYDQLAQSLFLDLFGDPVSNPKGWEKDILINLTTKIGSGATPTGGKEAYQDEGISLVRSMNVHDTEFKLKDLAFINEAQAHKLRNVVVEPNDVLFNITGASVCRCCIVPDNVLPARVNQHVAIIRTSLDVLSPIYLNRLIVSENCKKQLLNIGKQGGATREAITKEQLQNFEIIIPPISLQIQFADRIQQIEQQKQQAQASLQKAEELFQSLLHRAFKGELVS